MGLQLDNSLPPLYFWQYLKHYSLEGMKEHLIYGILSYRICLCEDWEREFYEFCTNRLVKVQAFRQTKSLVLQFQINSLGHLLTTLIEIFRFVWKWFWNLPAMMNQLKLNVISLLKCKMLQELTELSSEIQFIHAWGDESLRTILNPSIYQNIMEFDFTNCFKLVENEQSNILQDKFLPNQLQVLCVCVSILRI